MRIDKKFITDFNKIKNKENYRELLNLYFKDNKKCRICNDIIYYYDSTFKHRNGELILFMKSYESIKKIDREYTLSCCEVCLTSKYPEYQSKNKSRVFNRLDYLTEFAFDIPSNIALNWRNNNYAITEKNLISKYGEEEGSIKWNKYCDSQALSNTFEYKQEKYGWDQKQFDMYNSSRAVTLANLIGKHGEEDGLIKWNAYCDRQKYTTTIKYFVEKHGVEKGHEIYDNFCKKRLSGVGFSNMSKKLFDDLKIKLDKIHTYRMYFAEDEWFFYKKDTKNYFLIDCYIRELNIGIEFNGDMWHANPNKYKASDKPISFQKDVTAEEIWNKDKIKNDYLKTKLDKLIIIWESDLYKNGIDKTIEFILKEIYEK